MSIHYIALHRLVNEVKFHRFKDSCLRSFAIKFKREKSLNWMSKVGANGTQISMQDLNETLSYQTFIEWLLFNDFLLQKWSRFKKKLSRKVLFWLFLSTPLAVLLLVRLSDLHATCPALCLAVIYSQNFSKTAPTTRTAKDQYYW